MAAVFVDITMSLDGFVAGPGDAPGKGLTIHVAPILLGAGKRLFDHLSGPVTLAPTGVVASPFVTHLRYRIVR